MSTSKKLSQIISTGIVLSFFAVALLLGGLHSNTTTTHASVTTSYHNATADVTDPPPGH